MTSTGSPVGDHRYVRCSCDPAGRAGRDGFAEALASAQRRLISAGSYLELSIVMIARHGPAVLESIDRLLFRSRISVEPIDRAQAIVARQAFMSFGKGRHKAALNFGDCMTYALAKSSGLPLRQGFRGYRH